MLIKRTFPVAITMSIGLLVLLSYLFLPDDVIPIVNITWASLRQILIEWGILLAAFALVLGYLNLLGVHLRRIRQGQGVFYSIPLVFGSLLALTIWAVDVVTNSQRMPLAEAARRMNFLDAIFNGFIAPAQSALGALLAILIAVAGFRALGAHKTVGMLLFVVTAIIVALTQPIAGPIGQVLRPIREIVIDPLTTGGLRGLLLGVALGGTIVGFRVLLGVDKPQSD